MNIILTSWFSTYFKWTLVILSYYKKAALKLYLTDQPLHLKTLTVPFKKNTMHA